MLVITIWHIGLLSKGKTFWPFGKMDLKTYPWWHKPSVIPCAYNDVNDPMHIHYKSSDSILRMLDYEAQTMIQLIQTSHYLLCHLEIDGWYQGDGRASLVRDGMCDQVRKKRSDILVSGSAMPQTNEERICRCTIHLSSLYMILVIVNDNPVHKYWLYLIYPHENTNIQSVWG